MTGRTGYKVSVHKVYRLIKSESLGNFFFGVN